MIFRSRAIHVALAAVAATSLISLLGASNGAPTAAEFAALKLECERAEAATEVANLMGRYTFLQLSDLQNETAQLYALKTEGVSVELPSGGAIVSGDHIKAFYAQSAAMPKPDGQFRLHPIQDPIIVVAGDGKTAKGVFLSLGAGANSIDDDGVWSWVKYGVDFIKEEGVWKIWHLHGYPLLSTSYYKSWTASARERAAGGGKPGGPPGGGGPGSAPPAGGGMMQPDRPAREVHWEYNGKGLPPLQPALPEPYQSFDPAKAY